ncbi:scarecrow-like protein 32 [Heracleum sosnowskyi]|uniref:Scarecrow-like protein 32 n=1 Tax=Heracleum sosnowskyi TaxID=360622 RepID=A0AAD8HA42_9APIA|nr:scarecrow-like protein 32 [Heracleum sosnowskyi]
MMQFTSTSSTPQMHQIAPFAGFYSSSSRVLQSTQPPWPNSKFQPSKSFRDSYCVEKLLIHCANAIETNDSTSTQQILWVLNNIAPSDGDSNQRLTCAFLRALVTRAARYGTCNIIPLIPNVDMPMHKFSIMELASFVDLTPWHRFGFTAANAAILEAVERYSVIHIIDLSSTHCMQIPTLIEALANRVKIPTLVKLTIASATNNNPPIFDISYQDLGTKLVNFARSRNIVLEFRVISSTSSNGFSSLVDELKIQQLVHPKRDEALVVNCHMMLHYIPEETLNPQLHFPDSSSASFRTMFLKAVHSLNPTIVLLIDEYADFTSNSLVCRLSSAFNYLWIPYDIIDTFLPQDSKERQWYEADIEWKIENVVAEEGSRRVERAEPTSKWVERMRSARFKEVGFREEAVVEVKSMLDEHAAGWGSKREEEHLLLTWKGHNVVFATAWIPN